MRLSAFLSIMVISGLLRAQDGQGGSKPGWPCVPGRAVDPTYINISESTGGQLFLFQKNEVSRTALVMSASYTHPATVLRALGHLNGSREFEFPVDSRIESLLLLVSLQCRNSVQVFRPAGSEMTEANSTLSADLQAGKILRIDNPESGRWRIRLAGTGLYVVSVLGKTDLSLTSVGFFANSDASIGEEPRERLDTPLLSTQQYIEARLSGQIAELKLQLVDAAGDRISGAEVQESIAEGRYRASVNPPVERFRVLATGTDASAWPFQRMYPVLFHAVRK
jgi:hypothetical protein